MKETRDQRRLAEIQGKITDLKLKSKNDFNLPTRYRALLKVEEVLTARVAQSLIT